MKEIKRILGLLVYSAILFFAVSFISILYLLPSPLNNHTDWSALQIGIPFPYYYEIKLSHGEKLHGWDLKNLISDIAITTIVVSILDIIIRKIKK